ncbi:hypothetical protein JCM11641_001653 [Rhodosporidiobolus odoratus]
MQPSPPPPPPPRPASPPAALVSVRELQGHLALLGSFSVLEAHVRSSSSGNLLPLTSNQRWSAFLRLGALRLELWLDYIASSKHVDWEDQVAAIPDDAAVCWHAWVIGGGNGRYEEDCLRRYGDVLARVTSDGRAFVAKDFPMSLLVRRFSDAAFAQTGAELWQSTFEREPRLATFAECNGVELLAESQGFELQCPVETCLRSQYFPFLTDSNVGFCLPDFVLPCESCKVPITRELFGLQRFLNDLCAPDLYEAPTRPDNESKVKAAMKRRTKFAQLGGILSGVLCHSANPEKAYLASTALDDSYGKSMVTAGLVCQDIKAAIESALSLQSTAADRNTEVKLRRLEDVETLLKERTDLPDRLITRILSSYTTSHPFSLDVALSAYRLSEMTATLASLGWLDPSFNGSEEAVAVLAEAAEWYEVLVDTCEPVLKEGPLIAPLDIDFVRDVTDRLGFFVPHEDAVEETLAAQQWERLAKAWEAKNKKPLSVFALSSSSTTIGSKLKSRLLRPSSKSKSSEPSTAPPSFHASATVPSTHLTVLVDFPKQDARRRKRREGETPMFLRSASSRGEGEEGAWVLKGEEAKRGSGVIGVEGYTTPTGWTTRFIHRAAYFPNVPPSATSTANGGGESWRYTVYMGGKC